MVCAVVRHSSISSYGALIENMTFRIRMAVYLLVRLINKQPLGRVVPSERHFFGVFFWGFFFGLVWVGCVFYVPFPQAFDAGFLEAVFAHGFTDAVGVGP